LKKSTKHNLINLLKLIIIVIVLARTLYLKSNNLHTEPINWVISVLLIIILSVADKKGWI